MTRPAADEVIVQALSAEAKPVPLIVTSVPGWRITEPAPTIGGEPLDTLRVIAGAA
jgi:hypothetical protein